MEKTCNSSIDSVARNVSGISVGYYTPNVTADENGISASETFYPKVAEVDNIMGYIVITN